MQAFLTNLYGFIQSLFNQSISAIYNGGGSSIRDQYLAFLQKNIFNGTLISIDLTYAELLLFCTYWFLVIFFIVFVFKIIYKVIGLFKIWKLY